MARENGGEDLRQKSQGRESNPGLPWRTAASAYGAPEREILTTDEFIMPLQVLQLHFHCLLDFQRCVHDMFPGTPSMVDYKAQRSTTPNMWVG